VKVTFVKILFRYQKHAEDVASAACVGSGQLVAGCQDVEFLGGELFSLACPHCGIQVNPMPELVIAIPP
jgi:hypothetical protein